MNHFPAVRIEGGLLGPDTLEQLLAGELPGQKPKDFGLDGRRSLTDEIASVFADARAEWEVFQRRLERLPESEPATSLTRDAWMIPFLSLLGYELRYNPRAYEVDGMRFAISYRAGEPEDAPPVHIVGARQDLGRLAPSGRPRLAPHSLVQEYLNRSEQLWGLVTNGLTLRLLRDSTYVRRQAYVEFDLRQIFEEQRFADFSVLYRLLHRTRLPRAAEDARDCLLEQYYKHAVEQGGRVRERLRDGVEECIRRLANGFLSHPKNAELRQQIASSEQRAASSEENIPLAARHSPLAPEELYRQLLRLVYRLLFLLVSEDRGLISADPIYREHYGVARLRRLLDRRSAYTEHDDIWCSLRVLWKVLSDEQLAILLGAAPLNGELFAPLDLDSCSITNRDFLEAFWHLAYYRESPSDLPRRVNYAALDVEELGSVYESLLEYHPMIEASGERRAVSSVRFELAFGSERKSTGSYYTPPDLVAELIRSALEPVIAERLASSERRAASSDASELTVEEKRHIYSVVSRPPSVAERHGRSRASLPIDPVVSEGGTLRTDLANPPSGNVHSGEYRGRMGATDDWGISTVPAQRPGQPSGTGNPSSAGPSVEPGNQGPDSTSVGNVPSAGAPTDQPSAEPFSEKAFLSIWHSLPLAARRSLLAAHALLSVRVLDPACGSGHFLLAAARRLGKELAKIRTGEDEPAPDAVREAIRDVVGHCIYGVDKNPLAVELCRVALWLEAHCEGKPLTFLDHRIRCGDSLVGVFDLAVLKEGIPDEAFEPVSGDDRQVARSLKRQNNSESAGQYALPFDARTEVERAAVSISPLLDTPDDTPAQIRQKAEALRAWERQAERDRTACHLWVAAFFQRLGRHNAPPITTGLLRAYLETGNAHGQTLEAAQKHAHQHRFFHWPLEFPDVFVEGGFDLILSNPPWERIKLQEEEFFAARAPEIANAPNKAARQRLIQELRERNPALWREYQESLHAADATSRFLRHSGRFPLTGRGDINTYAVFAELTRRLLKPTGRAGIIVPTGIATDATTQHFFADLMERCQLASLYDFENRKKLFPAIDSRMKFCLLTLTGSERPANAAEFAFFCHENRDLQDRERRFALAPEDLRLVNPNTRTAPIFRSQRDAELTKHIYRRVPVLVEEGKGEAGNPWGVEFLAMFHMANDSHLFRTKEELEAEGFRLEGNVFVRGAERYLPLYEAKMVHQFDHRFGDYRDQPPGSKDTQLPDVPLDRLTDPNYVVLPRYWVPEKEVEARLTGKSWGRGWLLGWRRIARATDKRTVIAAVFPRSGAGDNIFLITTANPHVSLMGAVLSSVPMDFVARQKLGGTNLNFFILEQLPVLPPGVFDCPCSWSPDESLADWIRPRVLELTYTASDLEPFAEDLGYEGPPFRYDPERRFQHRCELDAAFFLLYLGTPEEWEREATPELKALFPTPRDAVAYILDQFPIVRRQDEERYGTYRTKEQILARYDELLEAMETGRVPMDVGVGKSATLTRLTRHAGFDRYNQAAVLTLVVERLGRTDLGRVGHDKVMYFVQEHLGVDLGFDFQRKAAGPWDPDLKYKVEPLAQKQGWLVIRGDEGGISRLELGPNAEEALEQAKKKLGQALKDLEELCEFFNKLAFGTAGLERWATIHKCWKDLKAQKGTITETMLIKEVLAWKGNRPGYDGRSIWDAIRGMRKAGLIILERES